MLSDAELNPVALCDKPRGLGMGWKVAGRFREGTKGYLVIHVDEAETNYNIVKQLSSTLKIEKKAMKNKHRDYKIRNMTPSA